MRLKELDAVCSDINYHRVAYYVVAGEYPLLTAEEQTQKYGELFNSLGNRQLRTAILDRAGDWEVTEVRAYDDFVMVQVAPPSPKITVGTEGS